MNAFYQLYTRVKHIFEIRRKKVANNTDAVNVIERKKCSSVSETCHLLRVVCVLEALLVTKYTQVLVFPRMATTNKKT